ncbi:hypothetical protein [Candidatus Thioglobus sp.]|jgi:hypothetical protein|uniref:hypothetical protein n=1 Tax=Candidatus Thioglobus sp. TaxID=2026721 RepID=UPI0032429661
MKNTLSFVAAFTLATSVMAGGDDRDMGPVESFDSVQPVTEKVVVGNQDPNTMTLSVGGKTVSVAAHNACKGKLGLSDNNIVRFKDGVAAGNLYNTGPIDAMGTLFSPGRWADYFACVEGYGG